MNSASRPVKYGPLIDCGNEPTHHCHMPRPTSSKPHERKRLSLQVRTAVLTEAGYRCAVPTCRQILALDLHHIYEVNEGGGNDVENLIALCPTDHALYHRGTIERDSIYAYKAMLVALNGAFDHEAIDLLIFLLRMPNKNMIFSSDGVLRFARLIASGLVNVTLGAIHNIGGFGHRVWLTDRGRLLIDGWMSGDRAALQTVLSTPVDIAAEIQR